LKIINTYLYKTSQNINEEDVNEDQNINEEQPQIRDEFNSVPIYNVPTYNFEELVNDTLEDNLNTDEPSEEQNFEEDLEQQEDIDDSDYPEFLNNYDFIDYCTRNLESINIIYKTKKGAIINRNVDPHYIFYARTTGNMVTTTFDNSINGIRSFIIDNILSYRILGKNFRIKFNIR
jgi:hypothetical protein